MDVAIYARISTDKQDNQSQLEQLRRFAESQAWHIAHEYVDIASGKSGDREQFKALFTAVSRRTFDLVLFWSLDRFSREGVLETLQYLQRHRVASATAVSLNSTLIHAECSAMR